MDEQQTKRDPYHACIAAGYVVEHHESDLYVKDAPGVRETLAATGWRAERFRDQGGALWWDVPFAFRPWWERRADAHRERRARASTRAAAGRQDPTGVAQ